METIITTSETIQYRLTMFMSVTDFDLFIGILRQAIAFIAPTTREHILILDILNVLEKEKNK